MPYTDEIPMIMERKNGEPEHVNKLSVGFGLMPQQNMLKSKKAGRPIFEDIVHIQILVPGDSKSLILRPATRKDYEDYPQAYAKFKSNEAVAQQGTPIEHWPQITRGEALSLKAAGIPTVEHLAEVDDANLGRLGANARDYRTKARAYINAAKGTAEAAAMALRNADLERKLSEMQMQFAQLAAQVAASQQAQAGAAAPETEPPKRRGRPPAAQAEQQSAA